MSYGVFLHRADSVYDDHPEAHYQFPKQYLGRAEAVVGGWVVYLEPSKVRASRGYFAVARIADVVPDPATQGMYRALVEPGTFLPFPEQVPFSGPDGPIERGLLNARGELGGNKQSAVRALSADDFARIVSRGLGDVETILPRDGRDADAPGHDPELILSVAESSAAYVFDNRLRVPNLGDRWVRDRVFRRAVLNAYGDRCALTDLQLINGGGRAEAEAAHIRPVAQGGPDTITNGLALCGTVHWMFDRGLIGLDDHLGILVSRQANDPDSIWGLLRKDRCARMPNRPGDRPHPDFLRWHRENCFKA